jgi:hypothetical protein|tara:strand:+ start:125 stop:865 length:741 start_codon:yes stop_codon:yes gene_type:complete
MEANQVSGCHCVLILVGMLSAIHAMAEATEGPSGITPPSTQTNAEADSVDDASRPPPSTKPTEPIEEIVVEGRRVRINPIGMARVRNDSGRGGRLYRQGKFAEAFPYLQSAAENGFKFAQARISYIYQLGLGGVPRDARAAIGWIGVAASRTTAPQIRDYFKKFMDQIPQEQMPQVSEIVEEYRARYGSKAAGLFCKNARLAGTHISRLKCDFKDEYNFRDALDNALNAEGIEASGPTASIVSGEQ